MSLALFAGVAAVVAYTYLGYPLTLFVWGKLRPRPWLRKEILPPISIIMAVRNGAVLLPHRIAHLLSLDYPSDRIELIVVSDGSGDRTNRILSGANDPRVIPILCPEHRGKASALNEGMARAKGEIFVFVDIRPTLNTNALRELVSNFADPTVGCAAGKLSVFTDDHHGGTKAVGGLYWRYEQWLRRAEARVDSPVGVYGGFYAVRRECAVGLPEGLILDDMYQPLSIVRRGWRSVLDEHAVAHDVWPKSSAGEFRRKVRTLAGNYQLLRLAPWLLGKENRLRFQLISHKLLRLLAPALLLLLLALNGLMATSSRPMQLLLLMQLFFYQVALIGIVASNKRLRRWTAPASAFVLLNAAAAVGLFEFLRSRRSLQHLWTPQDECEPRAKREPAAT